MAAAAAAAQAAALAAKAVAAQNQLRLVSSQQHFKYCRNERNPKLAKKAR
jgi:hypothetical protein